MTFSIALGWWIVPALITVLLILAWRVFGVRHDPYAGQFGDPAGVLFELLGYVIAALLSAITWLVWGVLK